MTVELLTQDGFQPRRKTANECCSPCFACGGNDRLVTNTTTGRFWCRQCNVKGDAIEYLRTFRGMTFKQAAEYVGKNISSLPGKRNGQRTPAATPERSRVTPAQPLEQWTANVETLTREASKALLGDEVKLDWLLKNRGITKQTAERFRLGWIYRNRYFDRAAWGLPEEMTDKGKVKKLFIPSGLLIPGPDRLRVRRAEPGEYGKYYVLPGSGNAPLIVNNHLGVDVAAAIIVESELDSILLAQELRNEFVIVAAGSTSNGPSAELAEDLTRRPFVFVALDSDLAGGRAAWGKWMVLQNAVRTPVPATWGKDHGEAHMNGHDLNLWLEAACEIVIQSSTSRGTV